MLVGPRRCDAPPRRALDEPLLDEVGLVHLLERTGVLPDRDREVGEPRGASAEFLDEGRQDAHVHFVETVPVHVQGVQRPVGDGGSDASVRFDFGEVPGAAQEAVRNAGRAAAAPRDLVRALRGNCDAQKRRRPFHDALQQVARIIIVPEVDAEPRTKRRRKQALAGGRADERERRKRDLDAARIGTGVDQDVDPVVFHGRVEVLLDHGRQAVDLVDEEDVALVQVGQEPGDGRGFVEHRSGRRFDRGAHLLGDDVGERGLSEPGGAGEQHMIEGFTPAPGRRKEDREVFLDLPLPDELGEPFGPQRLFEVFVAPDRGGTHGARTVIHGWYGRQVD